MVLFRTSLMKLGKHVLTDSEKYKNTGTQICP